MNEKQSDKERTMQKGEREVVFLEHLTCECPTLGRRTGSGKITVDRQNYKTVLNIGSAAQY